MVLRLAIFNMNDAVNLVKGFALFDLEII